MVRTDPGTLSHTTVAWIDRRGNPSRIAGHGVSDRAWPAGADAGTGVPCEGRMAAKLNRPCTRNRLAAQLATSAPVKQVTQMKITSRDLLPGSRY
jgi:hypothetical protein